MTVAVSRDHARQRPFLPCSVGEGLTLCSSPLSFTLNACSIFLYHKQPTGNTLLCGLLA